MSKILFYILLISALPFLSGCSKDETKSIQPMPIPQIQSGYDYFQNTNEEWYYELLGYPSGPVQIKITYRIDKDTILGLNGNEINAKVMTEEYIQIGPYVNGSDYSSNSESRFAIYFDKKNRVLQRTSTMRSNLGDFKNLMNSNECMLQLTRIDTIKIGKNAYTRYINQKNQEIIEGITLGFSNCTFHPPTEDVIYSIFSVVEMRYSSDQFTYEWE